MRLGDRPVGTAQGSEDLGEYRDWVIERCRARNFNLRGLVAEPAERGFND